MWWSLVNRASFWIALPLFGFNTEWCFSLSDPWLLADALLGQYWVLFFLVIYLAPGKSIFD